MIPGLGQVIQTKQGISKFRKKILPTSRLRKHDDKLTGRKKAKQFWIKI